MDTGPPAAARPAPLRRWPGSWASPFLLVRLDAVVSSYLGETASNLRRIMDYTAHAPFVVLFDGFDALGRSRDTPESTGR